MNAPDTSGQTTPPGSGPPDPCTPPDPYGTVPATGPPPAPLPMAPSLGGGYMGVPRNSKMAIASMVIGIASTLLAVAGCWVGFPGSVPALVAGGVAAYLGYAAWQQIRDSRGAQTGDGMAFAGMITGGIGGFLGLVVVGLIVLVGIVTGTIPAR